MQPKNLNALLISATLIVTAVLGGCGSDDSSSTATANSRVSQTSAATPIKSTSVVASSASITKTTAVTKAPTILSSNAPTGTNNTSTSGSTGTGGGSGTGTGMGTGSGTGSTTTASAGVLTFTTATVSTQRTSSQVVIIVNRQAGSAGGVTVNYSTVDGSAVQGSDYAFAQGTLSWEDGDATPKSITVELLQADAFTGTKQFGVKLSGPSAHASLGLSASTVTLVGTLATKSISQWIKCGETDNSSGLAAALAAAKNNAFALVFDCPVKVHFTGNVARTINVEDGTTVEFQGDGALTIDNLSPAALQVADNVDVTFVNWNVGYP